MTSFDIFLTISLPAAFGAYITMMAFGLKSRLSNTRAETLFKIAGSLAMIYTGATI